MRRDVLTVVSAIATAVASCWHRALAARCGRETQRESSVRSFTQGHRRSARGNIVKLGAARTIRTPACILAPARIAPHSMDVC